MYPVKADGKTTAQACARGTRISFKQAREIGRAIKGKKTSAAKKYLEDVVQLKKPLPFGRFNTNMAHRPGMSSASYPVNAGKKMIELLESAEKNAEYKGLEVKNLYVKNVWATRASSFTTPKRSPFRGRVRKSANVSVLLEEREVKVSKPVGKPKPVPKAGKPEKPAAEKKKEAAPKTAEKKDAPKPKDTKPAAGQKPAAEKKQEVAKV